MRGSFIHTPYRYSYADSSPYYQGSYDHLQPRPRYVSSVKFPSAADSADSNRLLAELIYALGKSLVNLNGKSDSVFTHKDFYPAALFKIIDQDDNKEVTASEINKFLVSHGIRLNIQDITRATMLLFDTDSDETVDLEEFLAIITPANKTDAQKKQVAEKVAPTDADGKPKVSKTISESVAEILSDQITTFVHLEKLSKELNSCPGFNVNQAYDKIAAIDGKDKTVSKKDLKNFCHKYGWALETEELKAVIDQFDVNNNGTLDREEFSRFIQGQDQSGISASSFSGIPTNVVGLATPPVRHSFPYSPYPNHIRSSDHISALQQERMSRHVAHDRNTATWLRDKMYYDDLYASTGRYQYHASAQMAATNFTTMYSYTRPSTYYRY